MCERKEIWLEEIGITVFAHQGCTTADTDIFVCCPAKGICIKGM